MPEESEEFCNFLEEEVLKGRAILDILEKDEDEETTKDREVLLNNHINKRKYEKRFSEIRDKHRKMCAVPKFEKLRQEEREAYKQGGVEGVKAFWEERGEKWKV